MAAAERRMIMTEFISRIHGKGGYEIIIKTDSHEYYRATEDFARRLIDHSNCGTVPVVRCKECKHCDPENYHCDHPMSTVAPLRRKPDDFCSYGERRGGGEDG